MTKSNWISVEERLPEHDQNCLFFIGYIRFGKYCGLDNSFNCDNHEEYFLDNVTYWMQLPEPPHG